MNPSKKFFCYIVLIWLFCFVLNGNIFPGIMFNGSGSAYQEKKAQFSTLNDSISGKLLRAGGYFFEGRANIQKLLALYELKDKNGINSEILDPILDLSLANIEQARNLYQQILKKAQTTPYNMVYQRSLKKFQYQAFKTQERLNPVVFDRVKTYLENGNITGVFLDNIKQLNCVIDLLKQIKRDFRVGKVPSVDLLWKLNESTSEISLFGSYVGRVCERIK